MRTGLWSGSTITAVPMRMRPVRAAMWLAITIVSARMPWREKWCSPSQKLSRPRRSACTARSTIRVSTSPWLSLSCHEPKLKPPNRIQASLRPAMILRD